MKLKLQYSGHLMQRTDPDAGKHWRQEEKGMTENVMVGWHHRLDGHEFEQVLSVGDGQGSLACCSPWGCKELDMTERLSWTGRKSELQIPIPITKLQWLKLGYLNKNKSTEKKWFQKDPYSQLIYEKYDTSMQWRKEVFSVSIPGLVYYFWLDCSSNCNVKG